MNAAIKTTEVGPEIPLLSEGLAASDGGAGLSQAFRWAGPTCGLIVGFVFIVSGLLKLKSLPAVLAAIEGFHVLPYWLAPWIAISLPWLELFSGLCLVTGLWRDAGDILILILLLAFTAAAVYAIATGLDIECGCFGIASNNKVGITLVGRNLGLMALTVASGALRSRVGENRKEPADYAGNATRM